MKQIGLGVAQYTQDYDEKLPYQVDDSNHFMDDTASGWKINALFSIQPYLKSRQIYKCPSSGKHASATALSDTGYSVNGVLTQTAGAARSLAAIPESATIIYLSELGEASSWAERHPAISTAPRFSAWIWNGNYSNLHFDGGNLLFADGHVKWKKQTNICASEFGLLAPDAGAACGANSSGESLPAF